MNIFTETLSNRRPVPSGEYRVELVAGSAVAFKTQQTAGVCYAIRICEGEYEGRECRLRALTDGPDSLNPIIARDMTALVSWADGVGAAPGDDMVGAMKNIWAGSRSRRVFAKLAQKHDNLGTIEIVLVSVRVEAEDAI